MEIKVENLERVYNPNKGSIVWTILKGGNNLYPVKIIDGQYYADNGRLSNFWHYRNLYTGEEEHDYGLFFDFALIFDEKAPKAVIRETTSEMPMETKKALNEIKIKLKKCCLTCSHFDPSGIKGLGLYGVLCEEQERVIACGHMAVCKEYLESDD